MNDKTLRCSSKCRDCVLHNGWKGSYEADQQFPFILDVKDKKNTVKMESILDTRPVLMLYDESKKLLLSCMSNFLFRTAPLLIL